MTPLAAAAADLLDMACTLCGWKAPAAFRGGASDAQVLAQGRWLAEALCRGAQPSAAGEPEHIPCVGELADRWPNFVHRVERAVALAESQRAASHELRRGLANLEQAMHWFPGERCPWVARIQQRLRAALGRFQPGTPRFAKLDVRRQFTFADSPPSTGRVARKVSGWLGIPSRVLQFGRDRKAHKAINAAFPGDHAGHLIACQFGGPADARNLEPQNALMNSEGTYWQLEQQWARLLEQGYGVQVAIEVVGRGWKTEAERPDRRHVRWTLVAPDGTRATFQRACSFLDRPLTPEGKQRLREQEAHRKSSPPPRGKPHLRLVHPSEELSWEAK